MEPPEYKSTLALEVLATSLVRRLTLDELEWLSRQLAQRIEEKRGKELMATSVRSQGAKKGQVAEEQSIPGRDHGSD